MTAGVTVSFLSRTPWLIILLTVHYSNKGKINKNDILASYSVISGPKQSYMYFVHKTIKVS